MKNSSSVGGVAYAGNRENGGGFSPTKIAGDNTPASATHLPFITPLSVPSDDCPWIVIPACRKALTSKSTVSCFPFDLNAVTPIIDIATLNLSGKTGTSFVPDNINLTSAPPALRVSEIAKAYLDASGSASGYKYIVPTWPFITEETVSICSFFISRCANSSIIAFSIFTRASLSDSVLWFASAVSFANRSPCVVSSAIRSCDFSRAISQCASLTLAREGASAHCAFRLSP